jgi:type IV secretory pathway VirB4 component
MDPQQNPNTQVNNAVGSSTQNPPVPQPGLNNAATQPQVLPQLQPAKNVNPNSTQNTLHIAEIRDGVVIMDDGSYRSVIMAQSINFDLMSAQERESVEYAYQGFLNSLYFPVQIFIRSQKIDMRPYLEKLDRMRMEQENMLLALLMEDYVEYIGALVQQTNIMDKKFYIVVPYFPTIDISRPVEASKKVFSGFFELFKINKSAATELVHIDEQELEKAKQELRNRVQSVVNGINQMGVNGIPLDTQELIELYYDVYNPDTATRQTLKDVSDVTAPIVEKGGSQSEQYTGNGT